MQTNNTRLKGWIERFNQTVWYSRRSDQSTFQWLLIRLVRTLVMAVQGFNRHHGALRASALTFFTLLSLVPVAAMAFGIAKGFGFERRLQQELLQNFSAQQEVVQQVIAFAQNMLDNTKGGMIAGIGVAVLFWSVIKVLGNIENSFNHIWGVRSRTFVRKLSDYLTIMLIGPLLMIVSGSLTVYINHQVSAISGQFELLQMVGPAIYLGLKLLPFTLIWILFTLVYIIMPNTRVRFDGALLAGVIAGSAYQAVQASYIHFQIVVAKHNAIYGSFAALPLFLIWLQTSWAIVLFGAEISFATQNAREHEFEADTAKASPGLRKLIALQIVRLVVQKFGDGASPLSAEAIAEAVSRPLRLTERVLGELVSGGVLNEVRLEDGDAPRYVPARDVDHFTLSYVIEALETRGVNELPLPEGEALGTLSASLEQLRESLRQSPGNRKLKEL